MTRNVWLFTSVIYLVFSSMASAGVDHVILVSIDGGKPASIKKSKMPNLESIAREGSSTFEAETILPSKTLPSHTSMITGVSPAVHKIIWNSWIPFRGVVKVPTIFSIAKANGYSTALFATKTKFKHLNVKNSLDKFSLNGQDAIGAAKLAADYLVEKNPNVLFVHLPDSDSAGHLRRWESNEQLKALENVDKAIGILKKAILNSLKGKTYALIITADHGGLGKSHGSSSYDDKTIPWITWGNIVKQGHDITLPVNTMDSAATVLWLLNLPTPKNLEGAPVVEAYL